MIRCIELNLQPFPGNCLSYSCRHSDGEPKPFSRYASNWMAVKVVDGMSVLPGELLSYTRQYE